MTTQQPIIRSIVRGAYDLQHLRIQSGLRVVANFKVKLGQQPGERETELTDDAKLLLKQLRRSHKLITDAIILNQEDPFAFVKAGIAENGSQPILIDSLSEYALVSQYLDIQRAEKTQFKLLADILESIPIYTNFLKDVKGIGPAMAGVIISEFNIHKATYPSSLCKYAGIDVAPDGKGRSRRKEHLIEREYVDKDGETKTKLAITFNPWLKTKLVGVLGPLFIKQKNSPYRTIYDNYKHRLENHPAHCDPNKTKGHRHNMAVRYMLRRFLIDLYTNWRSLEGLPVSEPYEVAKLGLRHGEVKPTLSVVMN